MSSFAAVTDRGATLLETDPGLGRLLGAGNAADFGHRRVLPVLTLPGGSWSPPPATAFGVGAVALVVLTGALRRDPAEGDARLLGPGDVLDPWTSPKARWSACSPVRAAVIGDAFMQAVDRWPDASARMLGRAGGAPVGMRLRRAGGGTAADRLGELLWRLAARWGSATGDGIALPLQLAPAALAALAALSEPDAAGGLRELELARLASRRADGTWLLRAAGPRHDDADAAVRDDLRERVAAALARARDGQALCAELIEQAAVLVQRREARRNG